MIRKSALCSSYWPVLVAFVVASALLTPLMAFRCHFNLGAVALNRSLVSASPDLAQLAAQRFHSAYVLRGDDISLRRLTISLFKAGDYDSALNTWSRLPREESNRAYGPLVIDSWEDKVLLGFYQANSGQTTNALQTLRKAWAMAPGSWDKELFRRYYLVLARQPENSDILVATQILQILEQASDWHDAGMLYSKIPFGGDQGWATEFSRVSIDTSTCWRLEGLQHDDLALERGPLVPIRLLLRDREGRHLMQPWLAVNLAVNGGFEWELIEKDQMPLGWPSDMYRAPVAAHAIVSVQRNRGLSLAAILMNSPEHYRTSLIGRLTSIHGGGEYLQFGWVQGEDKSAKMGREWFGNGRQFDSLGYDLTDSKVLAGSWRQHVRLVSAPSDAVFTQLWLLNFGVDSIAYFDSVFFGRMPTLACY